MYQNTLKINYVNICICKQVNNRVVCSGPIKDIRSSFVYKLVLICMMAGGVASALCAQKSPITHSKATSQIMTAYDDDGGPELPPEEILTGTF